jgi:hypothetical protein
MNDADTVDQQRVRFVLFWHPSCFNEVAVKEWLLSFQIATPLLTAPDKKLPKGCTQFTGHSLASVFERLVERFAFYGDTPELQKVRAHLTALAQQIAAVTPSRKVIAPVKPVEVDEVEELKRQLRAKDEALLAKDKKLRANDARHKREMQEKDKEIEELRGAANRK